MRRLGTTVLLSLALSTAMASDKGTTSGADQAAGDKARAQMSVLHEQMARYYAAKTPEEREKVWQEHMKSMREHMETMRKMMEQNGHNGMMMGSGMMMGPGMHGMMSEGCMGDRSSSDHDDDHDHEKK